MDLEQENKEIYDPEVLTDTEIKINPDFYIHNAIIKAQQSLLNPNFKEGLAQYRIFIEHIEILCKSGGLASTDYGTKIDEYIKSNEYKELKEGEQKSHYLANKKLELLLNSVFKNKPLKSQLKL